MIGVLRFVAVVGVAAGAIGAAPAPIHLVSNRALYDVSLERTTPGSIVAVRGRTVIDFQANCKDWKTTQRFVADMTDADGNVSRSDFTVEASEAKDGSRMRFHIMNRLDGQVAENDQGVARISKKGDGVTLTGKTKKQFPLPPDTVFPTEHTIEILAAATAGKSHFTRKVFQGGDKSDLYDVAATIGMQSTPEHTAKERSIDTAGLLKGVQAWPVLISYYAGDSSSPEYEVGSRLYANGIIGSMSLVYSRFTLRAKLVKLEPLAAACR